MPRARLPGFDAPRLRELRQQRHLSARDLADLADTSLRAVQNWENGRSAPDPRHAQRVATALGVAVRELTSLRDEDIGVAELRALRGLIVGELADETGIDTTTLSHIEVGHRLPTAAQADRLGVAFNLPAEEVVELCRRVRRARLDQLRRDTDLRHDVED